ncbi:uncharacterized protein LOC126789313 [Argentina anserina]|uniref:uncharacterized protein LOC126789313 n=1 Tax=Argentina anserina TaxID=57926 RepID=UPI0021765331|nr:uncharacterized protein LOC126789313 [Potentilla anserina]
MYRAAYEPNFSKYFPQKILQRLERDVHERLWTRWSKGQRCPTLTLNNVKVRDDRAILPHLGSQGEHRNLQASMVAFHEELFGVGGIGGVGLHEERDDFYNKLSKPNLSMREFGYLLQHMWYQNEEVRGDFPAQVVEDLRDTNFYYKGKLNKWTKVYKRWYKKSGHRWTAIQLQAAIGSHYWVNEVGGFRTYRNDPEEELHIVRNTLRHVNEKRSNQKKTVWGKKIKGAVIQKVFPYAEQKVFDFMYEEKIENDHKGSLIIL